MHDSSPDLGCPTALPAETSAASRTKRAGQDGRSRRPGAADPGSLAADPLASDDVFGEADAERSIVPTLKRAAGAFLISSFVHLVLILGLALVVMPAETRDVIFHIVADGDQRGPEEPALDSIDPHHQPGELGALAITSAESPLPGGLVEGKDPLELDVNDLPLAIPLEAVGDGPGLPANLKGDLSGRAHANAKAALVRAFGGNQSSEAAVTNGLKWLAAHQDDDGSWSFDHVRDACEDDCTDAGTLTHCRTGATGIALLAFLGAGHTHEQGSHQQTVRKGINFLIGQVMTTDDGGDLRGPSPGNEGMYAQGIAGMALCEAHAMTRDRRLRQKVEEVCRFIIHAQDPKGGGWRYQIRQKGDTSVLGWQLMALKSAQAARVRISPSAFQGATRFLGHVAIDGGAQYGYDGPQQNSPATTSVGLLCRMYLGWKRDNPNLVRGVQYLSTLGPSEDMYHNYYATQVMHHWGGDEWTKWNDVMRDRLIQRQSNKGHAAGSWPPSGGHSAEGGRLLETCLSTMTLEVYYRHLPLYDRKKIQAE